ncbi:MAG: endonuclease/exonuclease/phosphatase family protein [Phycisphaerae bacterium]|jgi:endonuclease/exonuclease/phosphatase family metal-dependent hydrolase
MTKLSFRLLLTAGLCHTLAAIAPAAEKLTLATHNCEWLIREKIHMRIGERDPITDAARREQVFNEAADAVADVLREVNADVLGLQEVGDAADVQTLRDKLAARGVSYAHMQVGVSTDNTTRQNTAVLSRFALRELVTPIPGRESYLKEADDLDAEEDTGVSKGLAVTFDAHGITFRLYVVHLKSQLGGYEADAQRLAQSSIVRRAYLPELAQGAAVIVMGDMNAGRGQSALRRIRGLDDIQPDLVETGLPKYFDEDKLDTRWTYEFQGVREQIDHILLSESVVEVCKRGGVHARTVRVEREHASDHLPLVVELELRD